jgi:hypothetical protein
MAETEVNGQSGKQAYTLAGGETPRAYMRVDVRRLLETLAGEDVVNDVQKVEQRYAYSVPIVASAAIKSGPGFLHALIISQNDAAPTAGTIDVYDSTAASGNKIFSWTLTTAVFMPFSLILDVSFTVGLYVAITTTADVNVSASYR